MKRYSVQLIAYSNSVDIIAESHEEAIAKLHQNYGLSELGIADTGEEVLSVEEVNDNTPVKKGVDTSLCKHTRVRFITEFVKKIPEGYDRMTKKEDIDIERDYETVGYFINKEVCDQCGKLLFSDEL
ncbi:unnamed protein product [marine sediment metagenome]|uniref:Uncharacterized protein n=1 Tax=marine sediment metagenome TaxID=412755 RepID=X1J757_9ZZZZ